MDRIRVRQILGRARERTEPADYPQIPRLRLEHGMSVRGSGKGRRVSCLTQQEVDLLLGLSLRSDFFSRLERGVIDNPPDHLLRGVAKILRLQEAQYSELHTAFHGYKNPKPLYPETGRDVAPSWRHTLHDTPVPGYINNFEWDLLDHNQAATELFGEPPKNIMRWILSLPPYSYSRARMPDWTDSWGPVCLSQLRFALNEEPHNRSLRQVEQEVLADPELAGMYRLQRDPYIHPDGTRRLMYHAGRKEVGTMDAAASEPIGSPGCRVVFLYWAPPGQEPEKRMARINRPQCLLG
ncbi:hypothetical protein M1P56_34905 (plasmid) [Streptomyces sp. HU2014]|uniref:MmyB family transcriptional regulator n=1 Tax=Streptomyces sp. HU2014 TaxID=2939414 RepID=UPI00200C452D|nr:hypothetical protein [Streptomyces sp. HU2014]UQI49709.1 hypothetical protein M1P56_34905 [Streptomyces sp. HU2014]